MCVYILQQISLTWCWQLNLRRLRNLRSSIRSNSCLTQFLAVHQPPHRTLHSPRQLVSALQWSKASNSGRWSRGTDASATRHRRRSPSCRGRRSERISVWGSRLEIEREFEIIENIRGKCSFINIFLKPPSSLVGHRGSSAVTGETLLTYDMPLSRVIRFPLTGERVRGS